jgi:ketosteroid isomerase-like protein
MKIPLVVAFVGLAISSAVPTLAQEQNTVDPEVRQQIEAVLMKLGEAYNKHDAAAITALYTQNAVQVWDWENVGPFYGQQAIEKNYTAHFDYTAHSVSSPGFVDKLVQVSAIGNKISAISEYSIGPWKGYNARIYVRDADTWKILMEYQIYPR